MKKILWLIFLFLLIPTKNIHAKCMYSDIAEMKKISANINYSYEYKIVDDVALFDITLTNLTKDIYFVDSNTGKTYKNKTGEIVLKNYNSGENIVYNFYPNDTDCMDTVLYTIRITLPKYNEYYNNPICVGASEYSLCQKWSSHNLDYNTFINKVNEYKKVKEEEQEKDKKEVDNDSVFHYIILFLTEYYYLILIILGITILCMAYIRNKRDSIYS